MVESPIPHMFYVFVLLKELQSSYFQSSTKRNRNVSIWLGMSFVKKKRSYNIWSTLFKYENKNIDSIHNCLKNDDTNIWQKLIVIKVSIFGTFLKRYLTSHAKISLFKQITGRVEGPPVAIFLALEI